MPHAVISDVHANLEALEAVLADLDARRPDAVICLGDFVGYGPDPVACVEGLRRRLGGAVVGNHDRAAIEQLDISVFNPYASAAIVWTREHLTEEVRAYLRELPETLRTSALLAVHGSPRDPIWEYVYAVSIARANMSRFTTPHCLVGHTHVPLVYRQNGNRVEPSQPDDGAR